MFKHQACIAFIIVTLIYSNAAAAEQPNKFRYPFYAGVTGGYGWTTWEGLVPPPAKQNSAINMSTPTYVNEGGALWGLFAGYELIPYFALEAAYMRYPNAKVTFDEMSLFTYDNEGITSFISHTEMVSVIGKIMLIIPYTDIRAFSGVGAAEVHRYDIIKDNWQLSPTFAAGFNYNFTEHVMGEFAANYTTGRGQSELNPAENYFPFIYSVFCRLAYRF